MVSCHLAYLFNLKGTQVEMMHAYAVSCIRNTMHASIGILITVHSNKSFVWCFLRIAELPHFLLGGGGGDN